MTYELDPLTAVLFGLGKPTTVINHSVDASRIVRSRSSLSEEDLPLTIKKRPRDLSPYSASRFDGQNTKELISNLHKDGHTCEYIADAMKMTRNNVRYHLKGLGLIPRYGENKRSMRVAQYDRCGKFITDFDSVRDANRSTGVSRNHIRDCCSGKLKSFDGMVFKYVFR